LFPACWSNQRLPKAALCDVQLDFETLFACSFRKISGAWSLGNNKGTAQAFQIKRGESNFIEIKWKRKPGLSEPWLGHDNSPDSPGFVVMKHLPLGFPAVSNPRCFMTKLETKQLLSPKMLEALTNQHLEESFEWLKVVATEGRVPLHQETDAKRPRGHLGRIATIGVGSRSL
jgi:hypothetical protein